MKANIKNNSGVFKVHDSYSLEDVLAAGGPTAFAVKMGKTGEALLKAMKNAPKAEPFTKEEMQDVLAQLENDK